MMNRTGLKYYLRALGIGITVTALLMGYGQKGQAQMTDEEILQRAAQLGMTESQGVLSELATTPPETNSTLQSVADLTASPTPTPTAEPSASPTPTPTTEPSASPTPTPTAEPSASPTPTPTTEPSASPTPTPTAEPSASPTPTSTAEPTESTTVEPTDNPITVPTEGTVTLVINRGESSVTVSKSLEELGVVEDYLAYDRYLCDKGYDHSICIGTYEIPLGATEEEITRIICKLR